MILLIVLFFTCALSNPHEGVPGPQPLNETWTRAVEEILASVVLATPLRPEFTPDYVAKRTRASALRGQVGRLRAIVASSIAEATGDRVHVCAPAQIGDEAVGIVRDEVVKLGFTVYLVVDAKWCSTRPGMLIDVPAPK